MNLGLIIQQDEKAGKGWVQRTYSVRCTSALTLAGDHHLLKALICGMVLPAARKRACGWQLIGSAVGWPIHVHPVSTFEMLASSRSSH